MQVSLRALPGDVCMKVSLCRMDGSLYWFVCPHMLSFGIGGSSVTVCKWSQQTTFKGSEGTGGLWESSLWVARGERLPT